MPDSDGVGSVSIVLLYLLLRLPSLFLLELGFISGNACDEMGSGEKLDYGVVLTAFSPLLCRQVLAPIVPSRLGFISSGDWRCFLLYGWTMQVFYLDCLPSDVAASLVVLC